MQVESKVLKIGEVAKLSGVGIETIRFYERNGLIPEPPRKESGYREYSKDVIVRLRFIRRAKELGFSLREINGLLSLRGDSSMKCGDIKKRGLEKIGDIQEKIRDLERVKNALVQLIETCKKPTSQNCPIVISLEGV